MKKLRQKLDVEKIYGREPAYGGGEIKQLLNDLERDDNPYTFKRNILGIVQLFFDGIIERGTQDDLEVRKEILETICQAGVLGVSGFYRGQGCRTEKVRELILGRGEDIAKYSYPLCAKKYHLRHQEKIIHQLGVEMEIFRGNQPEVVVPVASEGFEASFLAADIFRADILPMRFSKSARSDTEVRYPLYEAQKNIGEKIEGKRVLVVEGTISSGKSLSRVAHHVRWFYPSELFLASVCGWPLYKKDYFSGITFLRDSRPFLAQFPIEEKTPSKTLKLQLYSVNYGLA